MNHVLVLNSGSSSIKYQLVDVSTGEAAAGGLVERIGESEGVLRHDGPTGRTERTQVVPDHTAGVRAVLDLFDEVGPSLTELELVAVGHRVVQGGDRFTEPTLVDDDVEAAIEELSPLAPLHNPPNLAGIRAARTAFPDLPHVAIFDTAFHHTLPPEAYTYAIDRETARTYGIRRYGFHGTSHAYVSRRAAAMLGKDPAEVNLVVAHLGNGASITAVEGGCSVETSMGLTPLEGLVMGTRSGDLDPAVIFHLQRVAGMSTDEIDTLLNRRSGLLGLAGVNDLRDIHAAIEAGDDDAALALEVYCHRLRHYVGAYYAQLGRVDAVVFTAGVGENDDVVRLEALSGLERLGIVVDPERNEGRKKAETVISPDDAEVAVLVIPTNEELEIAQQAVAVVQGA
ncbi:acetate kinase [Actinotalea ferrariae CF5-4]|uniref:Acetate kinase n=1 Tax=Actinotalea ferrariae CF5-4 TaxID=948458 RepID=A0A021VU88_9CELL|nr:acetate kinase [Actinotalea ferrariae]EYR64693.1 acetate kinase [Actinotalea ferrariae CF5-4]